ncbi:MAG: 50S ribosomal protein L32 [Mycoplasmataceae bacterium]|jgi:large subunit ribosomal protein L32|nr:50S ribosomal protein L32 [Mycoplasmataceae bacterium]
MINKCLIMIVQQRRVSKSRKGMRRSHHALVAPVLGVCSKCGKPVKSHRVCPYCGFYKGRKVLEVKAPKE